MPWTITTTKTMMTMIMMKDMTMIVSWTGLIIYLLVRSNIIMMRLKWKANLPRPNLLWPSQASPKPVNLPRLAMLKLERNLVRNRNYRQNYGQKIEEYKKKNPEGLKKFK